PSQITCSPRRTWRPPLAADRARRRGGCAGSAPARPTRRAKTTEDMNTTAISDFLNPVIAAFGIEATVVVEETADGPRFNLTGEEAELLVRHRGEPLKALQHIVDSSYGRGLEGEKRVFIDALAYRKGTRSEALEVHKLLR